MKNKRIMILGAGVYQVPLIKKAKEMGFETIVVSPQGTFPGIPLADILLNIDTTDADRIVLVAKEYGIASIVTTGTDVSVPVVGTVVDALGLKGPTKKMADTVSSKIAFRAFLQENIFNCPDFVACKCSKEAWDFYQTLKTKIVIKPDDSSGSRGVTILDRGQTEENVVDAYRNAMKFSSSGRVCAESFIPGVEVGGDAFLLDGEIRFFTTTCKHMDGVIVLGHSLPGNLSEMELAGVKEELGRFATTLGYDNGPMNFDIMVNENQATLLEMGLRNGGNGILDLIYYSEGVDLSEWLVAYSLGMTIPNCRSFETKEISSYVFGTELSGTIETVSSFPELREYVPEVFEIVLARKPGDYVEPFIHNANLVGYLLLHCSAAEYKEVVSRIRKVLQVKVGE